ncbi:MAG: DUF1566 domain-containing protein [Nitrospirota bacterium]|nr:DUF1566 domain-containing protein [Nitrospirota bacterium]
MRAVLIMLTCAANILLMFSLSLADDYPLVTPLQIAQLPSAQGSAQPTKPVPGLAPIQSAPPQIQYSNEAKILQGVERLEQRVIQLEGVLKSLVGKVDILSETTRVAHEQQRLLDERIQAQTEQRYEYPPAQRWEVVYGGGAVVDKETGLIWQRQPGTAKLMWPQASDICVKLGVPNTLTPHRGWRLPTVQELNTLAPLTQQSPFIGVQGGGDPWYWTSTVDGATRPYHAGDGEDYPFVYRVSFSLNGGSSAGATGTAPGSGSGAGGSVWCVR